MLESVNRLRHYLVRQLWRHGMALFLTLAVPLLVVLYALRIFGLPDAMKSYLLDQITQRHLLAYPLQVGRLRLDGSGKILAEQLTVFRDATREEVLLQVDQIHIGLSPWNWWRGQGLVNSASIDDAHASIPVAPEERISFGRVFADIRFNGREIKIENARARLNHLELHVRGILHNDGFPLSKGATSSQVSGRASVWRTVLNMVRDLDAPSPIEMQMDFEAQTSNLPAGRVNFFLDTRHITWRTAPIEEISIQGNLQGGVAALENFHVSLQRGDLTANGSWDIASHHAELQFVSSLDLPLLAPAFQGPLGEALKRLDFPTILPSFSGRMICDLNQGFQADLQTDFNASNFTFNGVPFQDVSIPLAYDGKRLLIPGLRLVSAAGNVDLELFFDGTKTTPELNARYLSTLDPTVFRGVFGAGFDNFLQSCSFPKGGPQVQGGAHGTSLHLSDITFSGKINAQNFIYKKAAFNQAASDFTFAQNTLTLPDLKVSRPEGEASGGLTYNFQDHYVVLHGFSAQLDIPAVAPVMGQKFTDYTSPYHFASPPTVHAEGKIDFQAEKKDLDTDLTVQIQGNSIMEWTLFSIPFHFDHPHGVLTFKNRSLVVQMDQSGFYQGSLTGKMKLDLRSNPSLYDLDLNLDKIDFQQFMTQVFHYDKSTGQMMVQGHFTGSLGKMETMNGSGLVHVTDGDITQIPLLGSLTPLIPGFSAADSAYGHFTIDHGVIHTDDLSISSETLALIGNGDYNFIEDAVSLDMRVNAKSIFGLLLYPVSKIFEYHGTGPLKDVKWVAKNF